MNPAMRFFASGRLSGSDREAWLRLWTICPHSHPRQHPSIAELELHCGRRSIYLTGWRGSDLVAAGALSVQHPFRLGPALDGIWLRGPFFLDLPDAAEFLRCATDWARRSWLGRLRIAPYWRYPEADRLGRTLSEQGFSPIPDKGGLSASTGIIDLTRCEADILKGFSSSARYQIRLADRLGVCVQRSAGNDRLFFECFRRMQAENSMTLSSWREFAAMEGVFAAEPALGIAMEARMNGSFLGGLWTIRAPQCAIATKYAVVGKRHGSDYPNLSIGPTLFWAAIRWAKSMGCCVFDLDGYRPDLPKGHPCHAFCEFKKRLRPQVAILLPEHIKITSTMVDRIGVASRFAGRVRAHAAACIERLGTSEQTARSRPEATEGLLLDSGNACAHERLASE